MDIEKTMQFILEQQANTVTRQAQTAENLNSLVNSVGLLAEQVRKLDETMLVLAEAQIQNQQRFRETDERVERLISAIGEYFRR